MTDFTYLEGLIADRGPEPLHCHCGTEIVPCILTHHVSELCEGWRHNYADPALFHSIVCDTPGAVMQIARPK